ncbi:NnrU family protein [Parasulfitobacter algicola]|uniref:NnrU family protein n=1 Tax=Parasulfitobacter algicola TaxID=2614809 RepID=A0ABX2IRB7_9RHOB|nr:NnrU family protein [Sulfitobacter algicola]NSX53635.1 NnrU family protein [Sulfitobacter algicola]
MLYWAFLIIGILGWFVVHLFKRWFPDARAKLGNPGKGFVALGVIVSLVLIVVGYRGVDYIPVWQPPFFLTHLNNLLMLLAFYTYGASAAKGAKVWLGTKIRHPQLTGVKIWATAHLLVNGDLAAIILFGSMLAWAVISVITINKAEGPWQRPERAPIKKEIVLIGITIVLFTIVALIHNWLGVYPFGG